MVGEMKGQKLHIREGNLDDDAALDAFLGPAGGATHRFVAKLVGDLVAAAAFRVEGAEATLLRLSVRPDVRRLRIGTKLLHELLRRLKDDGVTRLTVRIADAEPHFLRSAGFIESGDYFVLNIG